MPAALSDHQPKQWLNIKQTGDRLQHAQLHEATALNSDCSCSSAASVNNKPNVFGNLKATNQTFIVIHTAPYFLLKKISICVQKYNISLQRCMNIKAHCDV